jgi:thiol-disulfide isomerase/thioredoxin
MPSIQSLSEKMAGKDFTVLAISVNEAKATVESFLSDNPYTFPIFLDESGQGSAGFVGRGIPTTYVVDKEGRAVAGIVGSKEWDDPAVVAALTALAAK